MKKITVLFGVAFAIVGSSLAQMAIPGEVFASNPTRYNGCKITLKNLEIIKPDTTTGATIGGPAGTLTQGSTGATATPSASSTTPCQPPRGFSEVSVFFKGEPNFKGCFFMADNMKQQLDLECGHERTPAELNFRGDSRAGYRITFYRLGM